MDVADACAQIHQTVEAFHASLEAATAERRELTWQQHLAVVLGAGDWAEDWTARLTRTQTANDEVYARALTHRAGLRLRLAPDAIDHLDPV